jgi:hypothetical protein
MNGIAAPARNAIIVTVTPGSSFCACCGALLPPSGRCRDLFDELSYYTLAHGDSRFIHQHAVDAYAVQHAGENPKPIATAAGLIGLYLFAEKAWTGRQVQAAHMQLGNRMKEWPAFPPSSNPAPVNVATVLAAPAGIERDLAIEEWARSVWKAWAHVHGEVKARIEGPYRVRP